MQSLRGNAATYIRGKGGTESVEERIRRPHKGDQEVHERTARDGDGRVGVYVCVGRERTMPLERR